MKDITLKLDQNEIKFILTILGDLPTKSNCYHLLVKIQNQANEQLEEPKET